MMIEKIQEIVKMLIAGKENIKWYETHIIHISNKLANAFLSKNRLYICGNGGSCSDASHIASEFIKNFSIDRKRSFPHNMSYENFLLGRLQEGLPAFSLSNPSNITAIANDMDYSLIFAQQIYAYCNQGDILIALSTSGMSANILNAIAVANLMNVYTIGFSSNKYNEFGKLSNYSVVIDCPTTAQVQETYLMIMHVVCETVEKIIYEVHNDKI